MVQLEAAGPINTASATGGSLKLPAAPKLGNTGTPTSRLAKAEGDIDAFTNKEHVPMGGDSKVMSAIESLGKIKIPKAPATVAHHKASVASWLVDMMSRPEDAVTNEVSTVMKIAAGKGGTVGQNLKAEAEAPLQGFFSTNPKYHETGSQLITQAADEFTKKGSTARSVMTNPWFKGIGGFVADVGLDPLTYIPGPDVVTIGRKVFSGGKDVVDAIKTGKDLAPVLKSVGKDVGKTTLAEVKKGPGAGGDPGKDVLSKAQSKTADKVFGATLDASKQSKDAEPLFQLANRTDNIGTMAQKALRDAGVPEAEIPNHAMLDTTGDPIIDADRDQAVDTAIQDSVKEAGQGIHKDPTSGLSEDARDKMAQISDHLDVAMKRLAQTPQSALDAIRAPAVEALARRTPQEVAEDAAAAAGSPEVTEAGGLSSESDFRSIMDGDYVMDRGGDSIRKMLGRGTPKDFDKFEGITNSNDDELNLAVQDYHQAKANAAKISNDAKATPERIAKANANVDKAADSAYQAYTEARAADKDTSWYDEPGAEPGELPTAGASSGGITAKEALAASTENVLSESDEQLLKYRQESTRAINNVGRMLGSPTLATNLLKGATFAEGGAHALDVMTQMSNVLKGAWNVIDPDVLFKTKAARTLIDELGLKRQDVLDLISAQAAGVTDRAAEAEVAAGKGVKLPEAAQQSVAENAALHATNLDDPGTAQAHINGLLQDFQSRREQLYQGAKQSALDAIKQGVEGTASGAVAKPAQNKGVQALMNSIATKQKAAGLEGDPVTNIVAGALSTVLKGKWGTKLEKLDFREALGRDARDLDVNAFTGEDQSRVLTEIHRAVAAGNKKADGTYVLAKDAFDNARWNITTQALRQAEDFLTSRGVPLYMGNEGDRIALRLSDALDVLNKQGGQNFRRVFSNFATGVPIMHLGRAISMSLVSHSEMALDLVGERMVDTRAILGRLTSSADDDFANGLMGKWKVDQNIDGLTEIHQRFENEFAALNKKYLDGNNGLIAQTLRKIPKAKGEGQDWLTRQLFEAMPALRKSMDEEAAARGAKTAADFQDLTHAEMTNLYTASQMDLPTLIDAVAQIPRDVAAHPGVEQAAVDAATIAAQSQVPHTQQAFAKVWLDASTQSNFFDKFHDEIGSLTANTVAAGEKAFPRTDLATADDFGGGTEGAIQANAENMGESSAEHIEVGTFARFRGMFSNGYGTGPFHDVMRQQFDSNHAYKDYYARSLSALYRLTGKDAKANPEKFARLGEAWEALVAGADRPLNKDSGQMYDLLKPMFTDFFGTNGGKQHVMGTLLGQQLIPRGATSERPTLDLFNSILSRRLGSHGANTSEAVRANGNFQYLIPEGMEKASSADIQAELVKQLSGQNPEHLVSFLMGHASAWAELSSHASAAKEFERIARKVGAWSEGEKDGFVRIPSGYRESRLNGKSLPAWESPFNHYFPEGATIHPAAAKMLFRVNQGMRATESDPEGLEEWVQRYWAPSMSMYKAALTMFRPAHHFDNAIGDALMTYLANGTRHALKANKIALQVLRSRTYKDVDLVAAAMSQNVEDFANDAKVLHTIRLKDGTKVNLTATNIRQMVEQHALLPGHNQLTTVDELAGANRSKIAKISHSLTQESKVGRLSGSALEWRDHQGRIQHFVQFLMLHGSKADTMDDLAAASAKSVRDYHPSANDLTSLERSTLMQLIPFYSWLRKAAPRVIQSVYQHPGRVLATYQASYNLGVIGGANPATLADPLDPNQVFPSYLTNSGYGPQFKIDGHEYGINPGLPTFDVLSMLSNPQQASAQIMSMESPIDLLPEELATRTDAATGSPITDWGDFTDQQIPGLSDIAGLTGIDLVGTAYNALTGRTAKQGPDVGGIVDYNSTIDANNESKATYTNRSAINYLLGARAEPWDDKNQVASGEGQQSETSLIPYLMGRRGLT